MNAKVNGRSIGDMTIMRALEIVTPFDPLTFYPETTVEDWDPHRAWLTPNAMAIARAIGVSAVMPVCLNESARLKNGIAENDMTGIQNVSAVSSSMRSIRGSISLNAPA